MAYGDIHNETGTICKAQPGNCPFGEGEGVHSTSTEAYVDHVAEKEDLDRENIRELMEQGLDHEEAIELTRETVSSINVFTKGSKIQEQSPVVKEEREERIPGISGSKAIKSMPSHGHWDKAINAEIQYRDEDDGMIHTVVLAAPVARLTDKKRIAIGRELFAFTGKDLELYDKAPDAEKLRWANQKIMRREDYSWSSGPDGISYSHKRGGGFGGYGKKTYLLEL